MESAYRESYEALKIAETHNFSLAKALGCVCYGLACHGKGFTEEAEQYLLKGIDLCKNVNLAMFDSISFGCLGEICIEKRDYPKAIEYFHKGINSWPRLGETNVEPIFILRLYLILTEAMNGEKDISLEELYRMKIDIKQNEGMGQYLIGAILINLNDKHLSVAEEWIKKAIEADRKNGMNFFLARDYVLYAELFKRKGEKSKAKENLAQAIQIFKQCGADGWVEKYEKELAELS